MNAPAASAVEVQSRGPSHLRVRDCGDDETVEELVTWLEHRPEVRSVRRRVRSSSLDVEYREAGAPGSFLRAARDRAFVIRRGPRLRARDEERVTIAHVTHGRVRLAVRDATPVLLTRLCGWLLNQPGVVSAKASLGSVVVHWARGHREAEHLAHAINASDPASWPPAVVARESNPWPMLAYSSGVLVVAQRCILSNGPLSVAVALTALPTARRTLLALEERRVTVDTLDLLAIGTCMAMGNPVTASLMTWLLSIGDYVLYRTKRRAHEALAGAMPLEVATAWRLRKDGQVEPVATKKLVIGDLIVCDVGKSVPADGIVQTGAASLDTKALTGESMPRMCRAGDKVMASSVVIEGSVVARVERTGRETTAGRIMQTLENAGDKPTALQRAVESITDRLVLPTIGLAGLSGFLTTEMDRLASVLITDFGTGVRVSIPTAALAAMTVATRNGVLVKGGDFLERLSKTDAIILDKTGTVTTGAPEIIDVVPVGNADPREAIAFAVAVETRHAHPIANALRAYAREEGIATACSNVRDQDYAVGKGLSARCGAHEIAVGGERLMASLGIEIGGDVQRTLERHARASISSLLVAVDGRLAVVLGYADALRPESASVVRALQAKGRRRIVLMSGDASGPAEAIARQLGVDEVFSELLPHEKADHIRRLQREGKTVAMIGDGINDAPALALADVGISLTGSTDVALATADVVLLNGDLTKLPGAFRMADEAMRTVRVALGIVIVPNAFAIMLGALGLIGPSAATVLNNGSTIAAALAALSPALRRRATQ